jgi:hypothetical protein
MPDPLFAGRRPALASLPILPATRSLASVVPYLIAAVLGMLLPGAPTLAADDAATDGYIGSARCGTCHATELTAWQGSHHDLAMAEATPENVLGDFDDAEFTAHGVTTRFYRDGDEFRVDTDGPDGKPASYPIAYTFGWTPLQQYLIRFPGGRLQALGIAWDSRPADQGGQRWFHLYPDEADYGPDNPLHWTNRDQTWNYQCAECHSTDLHKGYDLSTDAYTTTWAEIDVACEACHGPGAAHAAQAEAAAAAMPMPGTPTRAWRRTSPTATTPPGCRTRRPACRTASRPAAVMPRSTPVPGATPAAASCTSPTRRTHRWRTPIGWPC